MMKPRIGTPVSFKGSNFFGLLDVNDDIVVQDSGRGEVIAASIALTVRTLDVPGVAIDDPITVDGVDYLVRYPLRENDAALVKLLLRRSE